MPTQEVGRRRSGFLLAGAANGLVWPSAPHDNGHVTVYGHIETIQVRVDGLLFRRKLKDIARRRGSPASLRPSRRPETGGFRGSAERGPPKGRV